MLKEYLEKHGIQQKELAKVLNIDKYQMSKIANHRCMPTPEQAKAITEYLQCDVKEIFPANFVTFKIANLSHKSKTNNNLYYRLCVKLDKASCNCLKIKNLNLLGYDSLKSWVIEQIKMFEIKLDNQLKQRIDICMQEIVNNIKQKPYASPEEQQELFNHIKQKYFENSPQCDESLQDLIKESFAIVNSQKALINLMRE